MLVEGFSRGVLDDMSRIVKTPFRKLIYLLQLRCILFLVHGNGVRQQMEKCLVNIYLRLLKELTLFGEESQEQSPPSAHDGARPNWQIDQVNVDSL